MRLLKLDEPSMSSNFIFALALVFYLLSLQRNSGRYRDYFDELLRTPVSSRQNIIRGVFFKYLLVFFYLVGFIGILIYVSDFSKFFGNASLFISTYLNEAYKIRWEQMTSKSIGTQLSYFGWVGIALTIPAVKEKSLSPLWLGVAVLEFSGNFLFVDRTRPFWIVFTSALMLLPFSRKISFSKISKIFLVSLIVGVVFFTALGSFMGRYFDERRFSDSVLPAGIQPLFFYGTSGFAYFNRIVETEGDPSFIPSRTIYPLMKLLSSLGLADDPPSQINMFYKVPYPTNVGTFLEPFYRDGGVFFAITGMFIYSFVFDWLAFLFLRSKNKLIMFAWANICFVTFMSFFTPKFSNTPFWIFTLLAFWRLAGSSILSAFK